MIHMYDIEYYKNEQLPYISVQRIKILTEVVFQKKLFEKFSCVNSSLLALETLQKCLTIFWKIISFYMICYKASILKESR